MIVERWRKASDVVTEAAGGERQKNWMALHELWLDGAPDDGRIVRPKHVEQNKEK